MSKEKHSEIKELQDVSLAQQEEIHKLRANFITLQKQVLQCANLGAKLAKIVKGLGS